MSVLAEHLTFTVRGKDRAELLDAVHKRILEYAGDSDVDDWAASIHARPIELNTPGVANGAVVHWHADVTIVPVPGPRA